MAQREQLAHTAHALHLQQEYLEKSGHREATLLPRRVPAVPDLRFEQSYLSSIRPFVHVERSFGETDAVDTKGKGKEKAADVTPDAHVSTEVITIRWGRVAWITTRDQIISPLLQGAVRCVAIVHLFGFSLFIASQRSRGCLPHSLARRCGREVPHVVDEGGISRRPASTRRSWRWLAP